MLLTLKPSLHELSALVLNILRSSPTPIPFSDDSPVPMTTTRLAATSTSRRSSTEASVAQITPARSKAFHLVPTVVSNDSPSTS
ncbi:hypothetical protein SO802_018929 [Lithocarpus litseifolius]|uniref:Uncharacterized protein n=1 Tax=Lithocarpus litseifolius TaxID=425828 RepID=A0AAW2CNQ3_9ROSI